MKKKLPLILCTAAVLLLAVSQLRGRVIGTVQGAEMEQIVVDGVTYVQNNDTGFSSIDRDASSAAPQPATSPSASTP